MIGLQLITGVDFSKIWGGATKYMRDMVAITDVIVGVSQLLGGNVPGLTPKPRSLVKCIT